VRVLAIYGGDSMTGRRDSRGDVVSGRRAHPGSPGQRTLRLDAARFLVLDEADRMLDMGFEKESSRSSTSAEGSADLMFSAPSRRRSAIAIKYQREPDRLMLSQDALYVHGRAAPFCILSPWTSGGALPSDRYETPASSMIFCNTKAETRLCTRTWPCAAFPSP